MILFSWRWWRRNIGINAEVGLILVDDLEDIKDDDNQCTFDHCVIVNDNLVSIHESEVGRQCEMSNGFYGWCNRENLCTQFLTCADRRLNCDGDPGNGCEAWIFHRANCGGCGNVCPSGQNCFGHSQSGSSQIIYSCE